MLPAGAGGAVDAGDAQAGGDEGSGAKGLQPALGLELHLPVERLRLRLHLFREGHASGLRAVDGAAGEEDAAAHAGLLCRLEQAHGAVEIGAAEAVRVVAFAAPVLSGQVREGGVDEMVDVLEGVDLVEVGVEDKRNEAHVLGEEAG